MRKANRRSIWIHRGFRLEVDAALAWRIRIRIRPPLGYAFPPLTLAAAPGATLAEAVAEAIELVNELAVPPLENQPIPERLQALA